VPAPLLTNWASHADAGDVGATPVWNVGGALTLGAPFTGTAGRCLICVGTRRSNGALGATAAGWTRLGNETFGGASNDGLCGFALDSLGGETGMAMGAGWPVDWVVFELANVHVADITTAGEGVHAGAASTWDSGLIVPPAGRPAFVIGALAGMDDTWLGTGAPQGALLEFGDFGQKGNHPHSWFGAILSAAGGAGYNPTIDVSASIGSPVHAWLGLTIALSGTPDGGFPGEPGGGVW